MSSPLSTGICPGTLPVTVGEQALVFCISKLCIWALTRKKLRLLGVMRCQALFCLSLAVHSFCPTLPFETRNSLVQTNQNNLLSKTPTNTLSVWPSVGFCASAVAGATLAPKLQRRSSAQAKKTK
jgi:hypothetical protein